MVFYVSSVVQQALPMQHTSLQYCLMSLHARISIYSITDRLRHMLRLPTYRCEVAQLRCIAKWLIQPRAVLQLMASNRNAAVHCSQLMERPPCCNRGSSSAAARGKWLDPARREGSQQQQQQQLSAVSPSIAQLADRISCPVDVIARGHDVRRCFEETDGGQRYWQWNTRASRSMSTSPVGELNTSSTRS